MENLKKIIICIRRNRKASTFIILSTILMLVFWISIKQKDNIPPGDYRQTQKISITPSPYTIQTDENAVNISPPKSTPTPKPIKNISIPIQDKIYFTSKSKYQDVSFVNPSENTCNFVVSLTLPNKKTIYNSKMILPGKAIYRIELNEIIKKGEYINSILTYECYRSDGSRLNSAVFEVDIIVK